MTIYCSKGLSWKNLETADAVCGLGINRRRFKCGSFGQTEHEVHVLNGLSGCSFNQIVNATDNNESPSPVVNNRVN